MTLTASKGGPQRLAAAAGLAVWLAIVIVPLAVLYASAAVAPAPAEPPMTSVELAALAARSAALSLGLAVLATALGYIPGKILATASRGRTVLFWITLAAFVLPHHVLFYIWSMPLNATAPLGAIMAAQPISVVVAVSTVLSSSVLVFGYWPLAALLLAQGWRGIDPDVLRMARLEAGGWRRLVGVHLPLLARPLAVSVAACFVLIFTDCATFQLARIKTFGVQLSIIYELTNSAAAVALAAWPAVILAVAVAVVVSRHLEVGFVTPPQEGHQRMLRPLDWAVLAALLGISLVAPLGILLASVGETQGLVDYWQIIGEKAGYSVVAALAAAALALTIVLGVLAAERLGGAARLVGRFAGLTLLVALFLPGGLVGAAVIQTQIALALPPAWGEGWWVVSVAQAIRFAGVALIMLRLARDDADRHLEEMAGVDGASWWAAWWQVRWPRAWPLVAGAGLLVVLLSLSEVPATMMVLPAGVPNFTQHVFNQMHYFRDRNVTASCLLLVALYLVLVAPVVMLVAYQLKRQWGAVVVVLAAVVAAAGAAGCDGSGPASNEPKVLRIIGSTGRGPGELIYPRALDVDSLGRIDVVDRTGRIQVLGDTGEVVRIIEVPIYEKGYPTGLTAGPDGLLYVADTHYQRVLAYDREGQIVRRFGEFGTGDGQFIYPTDIAFGPDGRLYVSEYGGNDRVSIYSAEGKFLSSFGRLGSGDGEFSRPQALAIDAGRGILYVADACNHRIARYSLNGELKGYLGSVGAGPGQLRYPYGLALASDGALVVCENGNNRVQILSPEGVSLACLGGAGRRPGQLAYPWGVAIDAKGRIFVSDSGNNRIQVWQR
jgi:ABC-type Fe3+ transport system permease subunit/DNA-binding beta-propeller fold protein YncE